MATMDRSKIKFEVSPLEIVMRDRWKALPPKDKIEYLEGPVTAVFCGLRTNSKSCSHSQHCELLVREIQDRDMQAGLPDIRYNFLIGGDDKVYEGRGWALPPSLPSRYSAWAKNSIYVAFMGPLTPGEGLHVCGKMLEVVTRREWGAREAQRVEYMTNPLSVKYVFLVATHKQFCSTTDHCKSLVKGIQHSHITRRRVPDIKYNFLIGGDGVVYEGRGFNIVTCIPNPYNSLRRMSIMVAFMGEFDVQPPSPIMFKAFKDLIRTGMERRYISQKILVFHL